MTARDGAIDEAWQQALASEHQAVYGYGALGPRLTGPDQPGVARTAMAAHERGRNDAIALLVTRGQHPVDPLADYAGIYPVADAAAARRLAVRLEAECAAAWRHAYAVVASSVGEDSPALRTTARQALTECAVRAARWRSFAGSIPATVPFPGI